MYDMIIIGSGPSGSTLAKSYVEAGLNCLLLEAGKDFIAKEYPKKKIDVNSLLYWGGGAELNTNASLGFLRPRVLGGGSVVNQALLDPFDELAFESWREQTGVKYFNSKLMDQYYREVLDEIATQEIPKQYWNKNAKIFAEGFHKNGHQCKPLIRAQKNCRYEDGNDCIVCLGGCPIDSKQSMAITALPKALKKGLKLESEFEVKHIKESDRFIQITGVNRYGETISFKSGHLTLAAGSIGNSLLLLNSGLKRKYKALGENFFSHPQFMTLARYDEKINAHKGPFQSLKSQDDNFRVNNFKLENVFGAPMELAMLFPGFGKKHQNYMKKVTQMACVEVAIRDQNPGKIDVDSKGRLIIKKYLDKRDRETKDKGLKVVREIFASTGAKEIIDGGLGFGLHLMGGCSIGTSEKDSVISPDFHMHHNKRIFCADSSIFPNAPGINPSLTILALSKMAALKILQRVK